MKQVMFVNVANNRKTWRS